MTKPGFVFTITRLWRYFSLYFLKPFDAVNDTLTASLVADLDWSGPVVEIGSGDGEYSYVMHGGKFPLRFDRYLITDLGKDDIYDTHKEDVLSPSRRLSEPEIILALDARDSHVRKIREIGFAREARVVAYENLPIASESVEKIFYYTPHGLEDHDRALLEAARILKPGGRLLILLFHSDVRDAFLCFRLAHRIGSESGAGRYLASLDNGRHDEIGNISASPDEWRGRFAELGFREMRMVSGLSTFAWRVYDTQTRPVLKPLIRIFGLFPSRLRTFLKFFWMVSWFPTLIVFYFLFSNRYIRLSRRDCYLAFELEKIAGCYE